MNDILKKIMVGLQLVTTLCLIKLRALPVIFDLDDSYIKIIDFLRLSENNFAWNER